MSKSPTPTPECEPLPLKKRSTKFPQLQGFLHLVAFLQKKTEDIDKLNFIGNPSPKQTEALHQLTSLDKVVIKPSDKGGNIVLMDSEYYERMYLDLLHNRDWYRTVPNSFQIQIQSRYQSIVNSAFNTGTIDKELCEFLTVKSPRLATFYALPKTHKNISKPPGRSIVSGNGNLTEPALTEPFSASKCFVGIAGC